MATDNFNSTTPSAPTGNTNITFQQDSGTPNNVSAYVPTAPTVASVTNLLKGDGAGNAADAGIAASAVALLASPTFTGVPAAPTAAPATNTTQLATTAFVEAAVTGLSSGTVTSVAMTVPGFLSIAGSPITTSGTLSVTLATETANLVFSGPSTGSAATPTFRSLVAADIPAIAESGVTSLTTDLAAKAPLASPTFTGTPAAPTASGGTNTTQLATTAFVEAAVAAGGAVSSVFARTGAVTATSGDYTVAQVTGAAPLASPALTGTPTAPTATGGTNTTQIATTAFVTTAVAGATAPNFADNETPSGAQNGSNATFTLAHTPNGAGSLILVINGIVQLQGTDYTISAATLTLISSLPNSANNEWIKAWYRY